MRIVRVSLFFVIVAALAFAGLAPQKIFAGRSGTGGRSKARSARGLANQQQNHRRKSGPKPQQQTPTPLLTPDNSSPSFPKQIAGTSSAPLIVTITNTSPTVTVTISSVTSDNPNFTTSGCVTALTPGANCKLTVTYSPSAQTVCGNSAGGDFANISIASSDPTSPLVLAANSAAATPGGLVTDDLRDPALTANDLAQALVGPGVTISNVSYTGAPIAAGTFKGGSSIIGFDSGIILSNGAVSNVIGPNCSSGITWVNNTPGDQDLTAIIGQTTNDAAVLEFDFNPSSPTIRFQYVFASDEYQEFVFDFNDVFAFFVNGTNIALIPQTNTIVSINNVNNGSTDPANVGIPPVNPSFFVNNDFQFPTVAPFNTEMDGLTVVLTATAKVNPGVTNHIKLAVADALDFVLDSNVFIKGGSLSSTVVSLSPTGLAFGNENVGSTSAAQTVTLTNVGTTALTGVSVATSSAMFTQTNTCAANVPPGGTCAISVKFAPTAPGVVQGSLSITDSAGDSPQPVSLAGTGVSGPFASISPFSLTFGPQAPGTTSPAQTITVTNTGTSALSVSTVSAVPSDFKETDNCADFTIQPTNSCTISVTWTANPAVTPPESGFLAITDNAQNNGTQTVGLLGGATNTISISPTSLSFGNQPVNTTSAAQTVTITNTGNTTVLIPSIIAPVGFAETDNCVSSGGLVPAGQTGQMSCTIMVKFTPTSATAFSGSLMITDSAQGSPHSVMLTGTGTAAVPTLVSIAVTPATATIGVNATQQFTATGTFSDNSTKDVTAQSTWTSSAPATVTVGAATGLATGVAAGGPVTITATDGTIMGTAQLTVTSGPTLVSITVTPNPATVSVGGMIQFAATGHFSDNSTKDVTTQSTWTSANTGVATIGATTGKATGVSVSDGSIAITATDGNISGTAQLTVSNVPFTLMINPPPGGVFGPVAPGGTLPVGVILTAVPGTTGTVTFGCTTSSPTITCSPQPSSVALSPNGPLQVAIVVNTFCKGPVTTGHVSPPGGFGGGIGLLLLSTMLAGTAWMYRRNPRWVVSFALFVLIALGGMACNSLPRNPNGVTLPGNYQLFITATFNGQTVSAPVVNFVVN
jgi:Bacterial Ig-like domain (group 2)/Abnormal spindle-like microcephaly-assoc'd, ASPM-SPD-2-Hydin